MIFLFENIFDKRASNFYTCLIVMHPLKDILRHYKEINKMMIRRNIFQLFK